MFKTGVMASLLAVAATVTGIGGADAATKAEATRKSAYDFTLTGIDGAPLPLSQFKGKTLLVVNTASFCGFTPQYKGLQALYDRYKAQGLVVIGVPSGDFLNQEKKTNGEIKTFCETTFGINFPMAEKAHVTGGAALPIYQWARASIGSAGVPKWNFHKLLIGRDGKLITGFGSRTEPDAKDLIGAVEKALAG